MQVVGGSDDYRVYVRAAAEHVQIRLHIAPILFCDGFAIFRVQDGHNLGPLLLIENPAQLGAEITGTYDRISDGFHRYNPSFPLLYRAVCQTPAILFWIIQKKIIEGSTTMALAAIMEPQFRISAPSSVLTATDKVVLAELLTSSRA